MTSFSKNKTGILGIWLFLLYLLLVPGDNNCLAVDNTDSSGVIKGRINHTRTGKPIPEVNIFLSDTVILKSDNEGNFTINNLTPGVYILNFSHVGFETEPVKVDVIAGDTLRVNITMREFPVNINDITVISNRQDALVNLTTPHHSIKKEELADIPKIGEDIYRAVTRIPGVSSNDFSTTFKVRGGEHNQVLVLLDGLELYEPFHIKDIDGGILSIIDMDIVESVDLSTGAFSAAYGNHLSGVFNIKTKQPEADKKSVTASIDFLNARCLTSGTFDDNKGSWLASARRGYIDMVTKLTDDYDEVSPAFYDFFIKSGLKLGKNHSITTSFLYAHDNFNYKEEEEEEEEGIRDSKSIYDNTYSWFTLRSLFLDKLLIQNTFSLGIIKHNRQGIGIYNESSTLYSDLNDSRIFRYYGIKQEHFLSLSNFISLHSGININFLKTEYDYFSIQSEYYERMPNYYSIRYDTLEYINNITGKSFGTYLSGQIKIISSLKTEAGIRYDNFSYLDDDYFSPRLNAVYNVGDNTSIHCGWGYFYQPQKIYELAVHDGDTSFYSAKRAEHYVIGFEKTFDNDYKFGLEGYYKKITNLWPEYINWTDRFDLFQEAKYDRIKLILDNSRSKGLELTFKNDEKKQINWRIGYTLSYVNEKLIEYYYEGKDVLVNDDLPGEYDQRHALFLDLSYQTSNNWKFSLSWEYHSGWPYTGHKYIITATEKFHFYFDEIYDKQLPNYHRMDIRINRYFNTSKGKINVFLEIINLYNHDNIYGYINNFIYRDGEYHYDKETVYYLHFLPSLGISWSWEF